MVFYVEIKTAAIYMNAARAGKEALGIFTMSNQIGKEGPSLSSEERQETLTQKIEIALELAE